MKLNEVPFSTQLRKVLTVGDLETKAICLVPEWEQHGGITVMPEESTMIKELIYYQKMIQIKALNLLLKEGHFNFIVFRHLSEYDIEEALSKEEKKIYKMIEKKLPESDILEAMHVFLEPHIQVLPDTADNRKYVSTLKTKAYGVKAICIDYKFFSNKVLYHYFLYQDYVFDQIKIPKISPEQAVIFKFFKTFHVVTRFETNIELKKILSNIIENKLSPADYDLATFLSTNHMQNIASPFFWDSVQEFGFLALYDGLEKPLVAQKSKREDYHIFYSLESLLFFELLNHINKTSRCKNCAEILPSLIKGKTFKGKYCPP